MKFEQLTRFARGFVYAYNGIRAAVQEERNFRFHLCAAFYAFAAAFWAELDPVETALIALCVAAVLALELVNSTMPHPQTYQFRRSFFWHYWVRLRGTTAKMNNGFRPHTASS